MYYNVQVYLSEEHQFVFEWKTLRMSGKAKARVITYTGGSAVSVTGSKFLADGKTMSYLDGNTSIKLEDLPHGVLQLIETAVQEGMANMRTHLGYLNKAILANMPNEQEETS